MICTLSYMPIPSVLDHLNRTNPPLPQGQRPVRLQDGSNLCGKANKLYTADTLQRRERRLC
jgi:hypothetical protein